MRIVSQDAEGVTIEFDKAELSKIAEPIIQHAEDLRRFVLDLGYILASENYSMENQFRQPPHAFGD